MRRITPQNVALILKGLSKRTAVPADVQKVQNSYGVSYYVELMTNKAWQEKGDQKSLKTSTTWEEWNE